MEQVDHKPLIRARSVYRDILTDFPVRQPWLFAFYYYFTFKSKYGAFHISCLYCHVEHLLFIL